MKLVIKRREHTDAGQLAALVVDHVEGIEPGLTVLDSRLLLGQATIDVVALDAHGVLVLIAVAPTADEEMLLKAVEAYSWCLEYPEAIHRLYPSVQLSASQPPRLMFVVERMPDSFHRKIKQLGFPEVDCVEFRHLEVDGTPAVYFDTLARLRRNPVAAPAAPEPAPMPTAPPAPTANGRPTSLKLQKLLGAERPGAAREPAQVVRMLHRSGPRAETARPAMSTPKRESVIAPRIVEEPMSARPAAALDAPAAAALALVEPACEPEPIVTAEPVAVEEPVSTREPVGLEPIAAAVEPTAPEPITAEEPITISPSFVADSGVTSPAPEVDDAVAAPALESATDAVETLAIAEPEPPSSEPMQEPEPALALVTAEPELVLELAEPSLTLEPTRELADRVEMVAAPEPVVAESAPVEAKPVEPVVAPTPAPSVFARRTAEPAAPKVSFADAAKDLLAVANPTPRTAPPAAVERPSVEEMTRAALQDLVGATRPSAAPEAPTTSFARPSGPFSKPAGQKRPSTIAPPPSDPQPIAGGTKLGGAPKRMASPAPERKPETPPARAAEPEPGPPAAPQGFEGLQFPNDGVLTRQWMEFLNQMAAGK